MSTRFASWVLCVVVAVVVAAMACTACAEVLEVAATCESRATELDASGPVTVDSNVERYPETTTVLPMRVEAGISRAVATEVRGIAQCFSQFKERNPVPGSIPDELNLDAATYSDLLGFSYDVVGLVEERRRIRPTAGETGKADGEQVQFTSSFYIQGLLVAVAESAGTSLSGLVARVEATVVHEPNGLPAQTVMSATYELVGQADGSVVFGTAGDANPGDAVNLDLAQFVNELDVLRVAILPAVQISYPYTATVGAESRLTGRLRVRLVCAPGGTGVGAAFGMPGEKIGQTIDTVLGGTAGTDLVRAVNNTIATLPAPAIQFLLEPGGGSGLPVACCASAPMGIVGLAVMLLWTSLRSRRR